MHAENIRKGHVLLMDHVYFEVLESTIQKGSATSGTRVYLKLRNMQTGSVSEERRLPTDKVEEAQIDVKTMQFLYAEGESLVFMDPTSFEQVTLDKQAMGDGFQYLREDVEIPVRFHGEKALDVRFPNTVDLTVA